MHYLFLVLSPAFVAEVHTHVTSSILARKSCEGTYFKAGTDRSINHFWPMANGPSLKPV